MSCLALLFFELGRLGYSTAITSKRPWTERERGFFKQWLSDDGMCRLYSRKGGHSIWRIWGRGQFPGERGSCNFAVWELFSFAQKRLRRGSCGIYQKCSLCHGCYAAECNMITNKQIPAARGSVRLRFVNWGAYVRVYTQVYSIGSCHLRVYSGVESQVGLNRMLGCVLESVWRDFFEACSHAGWKCAIECNGEH